MSLRYVLSAFPFSLSCDTSILTPDVYYFSDPLLLAGSSWTAPSPAAPRLALEQETPGDSPGHRGTGELTWRYEDDDDALYFVTLMMMTFRHSYDHWWPSGGWEWLWYLLFPWAIWSHPQMCEGGGSVRTKWCSNDTTNIQSLVGTTNSNLTLWWLEIIIFLICSCLEFKQSHPSMCIKYHESQKSHFRPRSSDSGYSSRPPPTIVR